MLASTQCDPDGDGEVSSRGGSRSNGTFRRCKSRGQGGSVTRYVERGTVCIRTGVGIHTTLVKLDIGSDWITALFSLQEPSPVHTQDDSGGLWLGVARWV